MMNSDIRLSCSFPEHYKTKKLIAMAGHGAPFSLICLWIYAARNKPSGFLNNMDEFDIEIAANWHGESGKFFEALLKCKFLINENNGFYIKDWEDHQPYASSAEERSGKARFSILARHNPDLHKKLKADGVTSLTVGEYKTYTNRIPTVNESNTKSYDLVTPSPSPSPEPSPNDLPFSDPQGLIDPQPDYENQFEEFWTLYPKKQDKKRCKDKMIKILKKGNGIFDVIMAGLRRYLESKVVADGFVRNPATFINNENWNDDFEPAKAIIDDGPSDEELWEEEQRLIERGLLDENGNAVNPY